MNAQPIVEIAGASVQSSAGLALNDVSLRLFAGEVHSLMGESGAGKSVLIKALAGVLPLESGTIRVDGQPVVFTTPAHAQRAGIRAVYQTLDLAPNLTVAENVMLGREPRRLGGIDWARMRAASDSSLKVLGVAVDSRSILSTHPRATQQLVAVARALAPDLRVLMLDDPTSRLRSQEAARLIDLIRELRDKGVAILFVSEALEELYEISDRITVLRNGRGVGEHVPSELLRTEIVDQKPELKSPEPATPTTDNPVRPAVVSARGLSKTTRLLRANLEAREGEVLGLVGHLGSGRSELARLLFGIDHADDGRIYVDGVERSIRNPGQALKLGVAFSPQDRVSEGLIGELSVRENIVLALQNQRGWMRRLSMTRQRELATSWVHALDIRPTNIEAPVKQLSSGNQQKVILARLLALAPRAIILDEPTRGIDVAAKVEIEQYIEGLANAGMAVIFISTDLEEILRISHRILVLRDGEVTAELDLDAHDVSLEMLTDIVARSDAKK